ncbi:MAG TPA: ROK family transcriptional regulator [Burkholderiaceae bacterium]|nr:ROK family transcriptional regulator [Burkholderiaceae bacterium]
MNQAKFNPVEQIRVEHRLKVIRALRDTGPQSRVELCESLGLAPTTMTKVVADLLAEGLIDESGPQAQNGVGRPRLDLRLVPDARPVISVAITPEGLDWAVVQLDLSVAKQGHVALRVASRPPEDTLDAVAALVSDLVGASRGKRAGRPIGVAIVVPGFVDDPMRVSLRAPHIGWSHVAIADHLEARTKLPVIVHNNARAMALAELQQLRSDGVPPLLYVQAKHGMGAAIVDGVASARQRHYVLSELGNIPVQRHASAPDTPEDLRLGMVVTERHLQTALGLKAGAADVIPELERRALAGDETAGRLYTQTVHYLAIGLGIAIDLLNPRTIVLGGLYASASDRFLDDLLADIKRLALGEFTQQVRLLRSSLVGRGAQIGAAMVGIERFLALH